MSIQDVPVPPKPGREREVNSGFDISDLDLSPLFVEPDPTGPLAKLLPWINFFLMLIMTVVIVLSLIFK